MANATTTRRAIAAGLKELMATRPLAELSVGDIARQCRVSRNTFYYHFKDKYDLLQWLFQDELSPLLEPHAASEDWAGGLQALCGHMQAEQAFYLRVLQVRERNIFGDCLMRFYERQLALAVCGPEGDPGAPSARLMARFYAHALVGVLMDWAFAGMRQDPLPFIQMLDELLSGRATGRQLARRPWPDPTYPTV